MAVPLSDTRTFALVEKVRKRIFKDDFETWKAGRVKRKIGQEDKESDREQRLEETKLPSVTGDS